MLIVIFGRYGFPHTLVQEGVPRVQQRAADGSGRSEQPSLQPLGQRPDRVLAHGLAAGDDPPGPRAAGQEPTTSSGSSTRGSAGRCTTHTTSTSRRSPSSGRSACSSWSSRSWCHSSRRGERGGQPLAAVVFGVYVAFLLHAAADWDWEMPAVMLTGLFCGIALLAAGRREGRRGRFVVACAFPAVAVLGAVRLRAARAAREQRGLSELQVSRRGQLRTGRGTGSEGDALRAVVSAPWRRLGEAQSLAGDLAAAG